jgi:hypothetical protein
MNDSEAASRACETNTRNWARIAAAGSLLAGGLLLLTRQRRAGLAAASSGTALALLDQQDAVRACWNALPGYLDHVQRILDQAQDILKDVVANREKLGQILDR